MVTVATRIEPQEVEKLRELSAECGISVCAYLRDLIRLELGRARRIDQLAAPVNNKGMTGDSAAFDIAV